MANSSIKVNGKIIRPAWKWERPVLDWPGHDQAQTEMLESIRNVLEGIADCQMLQCSVAGDIHEIARTLNRMDRRQAKAMNAGKP